MRVHILSDLHLEFEGGATPDTLVVRPPWNAIHATESDVVILAGDTATKGRGPELARELFPGRNIVMVAGNHEYYGEVYPHHLFRLEESAEQMPGLHFLENRVVEIDDVVFLGCTLWSDAKLFDSGPRAGLFSYPSVLLDMQAGMNDYRRITFFDGKRHRGLRPADTILEHKNSVRWLREQFKIFRGRKIVVVTHHAPSWRSVAPEYQEDALSAAYASHLDELVEASGALLWIHGHSHVQMDYMIGHTRVIANPKGYPFERNQFRPRLVIDV